MPTDAHFNDPLLNDAFDFSRYPIFKARNAELSTTPREPRNCGRVLFTYDRCGSLSSRGGTCWRSRNVSEPQLISSTNCLRESWFAKFVSARTMGNIASLPSDDDISAAVRPSQSTTVIDTPGARTWCDMADGHLEKTPATREDSCNTSGHIEPSDFKGEDDSLYSMDSAHQDVHPLLLSMPVIPQIKLERKATVRKPDPGPPLSDTTQNQSLLSPRIWKFRTPARMSSRRYGRIITKSHDHGTFTFQTSRRFGSTSWSDHMENGTTELGYVHSVSEPMLNFPNTTSDDEKSSLLKKEIDESPHSDVLLSMIDEVGSSPGPYSDRPGSGVEKPLPKHLKRSHQRSFIKHSISFSNLVHAVADGYASLDLLLRRPMTKSRSTVELKSNEHVPAHEAANKWAPIQEQIIIKVFVPSTDDTWMFRVPQEINLAAFTSRVVTKLGFTVSFSGSPWDEPKYHFLTDEQFKSWVKGRIRFGRNLPIVAHVLAPLPLVKLSVDGDGCEVWCYA